MTSQDIVKFSKSGTIIYVDTRQVKENYTNSVGVYSIPTTQDSPDDPMLLNLNKIEDRFTITGHLSNGKYDAAETYTTAKDKKDGLKIIFAKGSTVTMTYEGTDYDVAVDKYQITYDAHDEGSTNDDGVVVYSVIISCVVGGDLV